MNMISENRSHQLPLFGHFCCRLAAQPDCVSQESCSGDLTVLDGGTGRQWVFMWGQLQAFRLDLWVKREHWEQGQDPVRSITVDRVSETHFGDQAKLLVTSNYVKLRISEIVLSSRDTLPLTHVVPFGPWKEETSSPSWREFRLGGKEFSPPPLKHQFSRRVVFKY